MASIITQLPPSKKIRIVRENVLNYLRDGILFDNTYFGVILEYFHSIEYVKTICLLSKYHHKFIKNNHRMMLRIITKEFVDIRQLKPLNKEPEYIYSIIWFLHNIWRNDLHEKYTNYDYLSIQQQNEDKYFYERICFLSRWGELNIFTVYAIKYWFNAISKATNIPMDKIGINREEMTNNMMNPFINPIPCYITMQYDDEADHIQTQQHILDFCGLLLIFVVKPEKERIEVVKEIYIWFAENQWFNTKFVIEMLHKYAIFDNINTYPLIAFCWDNICNQYETTLEFQDEDAIFSRMLLYLFCCNKSSNEELFDYQQCFKEFRKYNLITRMSGIWSQIVDGEINTSIAYFYVGLQVTEQPYTARNIDLPTEWK